MELDPLAYVHQFMLCEEPQAGPAAWQHRNLGSWHVWAHPTLPIIDVSDSDGSALGWLLGWPIDVERASFTTDTITLDRTHLEDQLYRLGGRWIAALVGASKVYLNATGEMPCVFSSGNRMVASTTSLVPPSDPTDDHRSLQQALDIPASDNFYPLDLTADPGCNRLLPNHCLDLDSFRAQRHWPGEGELSEGNEDGSVEAVAGLAVAHVDAIAERFPLQGNLTSGRDTRLILALARSHAAAMEFLTRDSPSYKDSVDTYAARALADRFGLDLRVILDVPATVDQLSHWQERTGRCIAGSVWRSVATWAQSDPSRANLPGMVAHLARANYASRGVNPYKADNIASVLRVPSHPAISEAAARWLSAVPSVSKRVHLDLLYLEISVGCWAAPTLYGNHGDVPSFWLLSHREIVRRMLDLSAETKEQQRLSSEVIGLRWPELLEIPFNQPFGPGAAKLRLRGAQHMAKRAIPHLIDRAKAARR